MANPDAQTVPALVPPAVPEPEHPVTLTAREIRLIVTLCEQSTCGDKVMIGLKHSVIGKMLPHFVDGPRPPGQ